MKRLQAYKYELMPNGEQHLERAYKNFFAKRADFPRLKRKGSGESFSYPDAKQFKLDAGKGRIFLPKRGWMRVRLSQEVLGTLKNATVSLSAGKDVNVSLVTLHAQRAHLIYT